MNYADQSANYAPARPLNPRHVLKQTSGGFHLSLGIFLFIKMVVVTHIETKDYSNEPTVH